MFTKIFFASSGDPGLSLNNIHNFKLFKRLTNGFFISSGSIFTILGTNTGHHLFYNRLWNVLLAWFKTVKQFRCF